jgi:hypothetical protein
LGGKANPNDHRRILMNTLSAPAPKKTNKIWIIVIVLLILCCLCSLVGVVIGYFYFQKEYSGTGEIFELVSEIAKPGEEIRCEAGGYAFKMIPGYGYTPCWDSGVSVLTSNELLETTNYVIGEGPQIMFDGFVPSSDLSFENYVKNGNKDMRLRLNATISGEPQVSVAGLMGVAFDYDYELAGAGKMKARDISVEVNPKQFFWIHCRSTIEKWDKALADCETVINSITFFEPLPSPTQIP